MSGLFAPACLVVVEDVRALLLSALSPAGLVVVKDVRALQLRALLIRLNGNGKSATEEGNKERKRDSHLGECRCKLSVQLS